MLRPNLRVFVCAIVAVFMSFTAAYAGPMTIPSKDIKPLNTCIDGTIGLAEELLFKAEKAVTDNSVMDSIITHSRSGVNHWEVAETYKNRAEAFRKGLGSSRTTFDRVREAHYMTSRPGYYEVYENLFNRSLEGDAGEPTDSERAKAMVTLRERANELVKVAKELRAFYYSENFGELAFLSESNQIELCAQWIRFKNQVDVLRPDIKKDMTAVRAGSMNLTALAHYKPSGLHRNYWALSSKHKPVFEDIYTKMRKQYDPLVRKGVEPMKSFTAMNTASALSGRIEWDLGAAEEDDAYNAAETVLELIGDADTAIASFMAGLKETLPNAAEVIAAAEKKAGSASSDVSGDNGANSDAGADNTQDQEVPSEIALGGVPVENGAETTADSTTQTQTTPAYATQGGTYTVQDGDSFGQITKDQLQQAFLDAGWKKEDIPGLWNDGGLVQLLAQFNNISNPNVINTDSVIKIPPIPAAPADESQRQEAFQSWSGNLGDSGAISQDVVDNSGSTPTTTQANAMTSERIYTEVGGFMTKYFIKTSDAKTLEAHLRKRPADGNFSGTNGDLLLWSVNVTFNSIEKVAAQNDGKVEPGLAKLYDRARKLKEALLHADTGQSEEQMRTITNRYVDYLSALGLK